ncbi:MAG TPA: hypothetical protein VGK45_07780 [Thermoanaerobaculia bacterium]
MQRRDFLKSLLAAAAFTGLGRRAFAQANRRVSLGLLLDPETPEGRGALLGVEEAQHVGKLLHVEITAGPTSDFALIGLTAPQEAKTLFLEAAPQATSQGWNVTSSPAFRQQALDRFKDRQDLRVSDWHAGLMKFGAEELNVRFHRRFGQPMDERSWHGWIAVKCAVELALRYPAGNPREQIASLSLDGHKGMLLNFDPRNRHLVQPVYLIDAQGKLVEQVEPA